jgi:hypothetical protein
MDIRGGMRVRVMALVTGLALLGACNRPDPVLFDGLVFDARADAPRDDRRAFTATVRDAGVNPAAARDAGRHAGTTHCMRYFGGSDIDWTGPGTTATDPLAITEDGTLVLTGRCVAR